MKQRQRVDTFTRYDIGFLHPQCRIIDGITIEHLSSSSEYPTKISGSSSGRRVVVQDNDESDATAVVHLFGHQ